MSVEYKDYLEDEAAEDRMHSANSTAHDKTMNTLEGILATSRHIRIASRHLTNLM